MIETLDKTRRTEIVEVFGAAFKQHPLLPPDPSGRTSRLLAEALLDAFADAPDSRVFGIRRDERLDCAAFVFDAAFEPRGFKLALLLIRMVRFVGWRMSRTMAQVLSAKHEGEERRLELMIIGTREGCQKLGLGRAMMHHVFAYALGRGYRSVVLEVAKETPAFRFYLREGFLVEKEIALPAMPLCLLWRPLAEQGAGGDGAGLVPPPARGGVG